MTCTPLAQARQGEFTLHFEFGELGFVVVVGNRAGTQAVADAEGSVIRGHVYSPFMTTAYSSSATDETSNCSASSVCSFAVGMIAQS
jgi:hypothetical protein